MTLIWSKRRWAPASIGHCGTRTMATRASRDDRCRSCGPWPSFDLAAQSMRQEPTDASVPDRYRVAAVYDHGDPTAPAEAACESTAYRVVLDAGGEVLDAGRQTSRWPVAIRRAVTIRDRGCVFPGCGRPSSWCDVHHCIPWHEDGTTSADNGALLCRRHHTFVHQRGWRVRVDDGQPVVRRPDSTPYVIIRWPTDARAS